MTVDTTARAEVILEEPEEEEGTKKCAALASFAPPVLPFDESGDGRRDIRQ